MFRPPSIVPSTTDHDGIRFVREALHAAKDQAVVVIPGIEVSANDGHLRALFDPDNLETGSSVRYG